MINFRPIFPLILFAASLLTSNVLHCQTNLAPNPSFEFKNNCPSSLSNISDAKNWYGISGSPDYFNKCATFSSNAGVTLNILGYQNAFDGDAYAGLFTYAKGNLNGNELIEAPLNGSLIIGTRYFVSVYIAKTISSITLPPVNCSNNKFGVKFSTKPYTANLSFNNAHVKSDLIVSDTLNWTRIEGSFISDSSYSYISLGNFYDNINTDTIDCHATAYYFVDMICVSNNSLTCNLTTGFSTIFKETKWTIFPNPVTSILSIETQSSGTFQLFLFSPSGSEISKLSFVKNATIDLSIFPSGIYFLLFKNETSTWTRKIQIQHD